jgi:iron-sulfur cluster repair protein YtfE (RIC family)
MSSKNLRLIDSRERLLELAEMVLKVHGKKSYILVKLNELIEYINKED